MNLKKFSELFKFENQKIEYCLNLLIKKNTIIVSGSILDNKPFITLLNKKNILNKLKWYIN